MGLRVDRPVKTFLAVGAIVGGLLVVFVPRWAGIDEPYHFLRTSDILAGRPMPARHELPGDEEGGALCVPDSRLEDLFEDRTPYLRALNPEWDGTDPLAVGEGCSTGGEAGHLVDVATFSWYNPLAYAPQVIGVGGGRLLATPFGSNIGFELLAGRLATMAAYLALCGAAIALAPRARWALVAVALLPASLFQAATSLSPDAFTIAAVLLLVSAALRAADPDLALSTKQVLIEATVVCGILVIAKPTYVVLVSCYLVVFAGRADDVTSRWRRWPLVAPVLGALALSMAWSTAFRDLFVCDVRYFGVGTDPEGQLSTLLHRPWSLLSASARAVLDHGSRWLRDVATLGERVVPWGLAASTAVVAGFTVLGLSPDRRPPSSRGELTAAQRMILVASGAAGYLAVTAGWIISCSPPGIAVDNPPHARLLVPVLAPVLVGLSLPPREDARSRFPLAAVLLGAGYLVWIAALVDRMAV